MDALRGAGSTIQASVRPAARGTPATDGAPARGGVPREEGPARGEDVPLEEPATAGPRLVAVRRQARQGPPELEEAFARMEAAGIHAAAGEAAHVQESLEAGFESLVPLKKDGQSFAVSFHARQDLADYAQMVAGRPPTRYKAAFEAARALQQKGSRLYLLREEDRGGLLPSLTAPVCLDTDAGGAALLLERGEPVFAVSADGAVRRLNSAAQAAQAARASAPGGPEARAGELIREVARAGYEVQPDFELPENLKATDIKGLMKQQIREWLASRFKEDPRSHPLLRHGYMARTLSQGGVVQVLPPEGSAPDEEPEFPLTLDQAQLQTLVRWEKSPTRAMMDFRQAFESLEKGGSILMARGMAGMNRGMLHRADALRAYLNLAHGGEVVALGPGGDLFSLRQPVDLLELQKTGGVARSRPAAPADPARPKANLFMLYFVSPFDPLEKGLYEDLPLRLTQVGSSEQTDFVTLRSDLPQKRNLRRDYIQPGELAMLERLDVARVSMADPKTLEDFIYKTVREHPGDRHLRLMVAGHGGAEKGLLPDGADNNAQAHNAMSVDDFAGAIKQALDRVERETGRRPRIDNLIVGSCLMGNTSFIHALARTGDVGVLSASPEVLMGNDPEGMFTCLNDPRTADADAQTYARALVDILKDASAFPGGKKNLQFAETIAAYDLDPGKDQAFTRALDNFFSACASRPDLARYVKEDVADCPTYGINRIYNVMMGVQQRDLIQVAERILGDARIDSDPIKQACKELIEASSAQVLAIEVAENYRGRKGATLYLPLERGIFDPRMADTHLLKSTSYRRFLDTLFEAPLHRTLIDTFFDEIDRAMAGVRQEQQKAQSSAGSSAGSTAPAAKPSPGGLAALKKELEEAAEHERLHDMERPQIGAGRRVAMAVGQGLRLAGGVAGALVGGALGAALAAPVGLVLGLRAGLTGRSLASPENSGPRAPDPDGASAWGALDAALPAVRRLAVQAALTPFEGTGQKVHKAVGYRMGVLPGRLAGALAGAAGGALGGALAGLALGGFGGAALGRGLLSLFTPFARGPRKSRPEDLPFL